MPSVVDICAFALLVLGILVGLRRGLSGEVANLLSLVVGFMAGVTAHRLFDAGWPAPAGRAGLHAVAGVVVALVAGTVAMALARFVCKRLIRIVIEEESDRVWGAVVGGLRSAIFVLAIFIVMNLLPNERANRWFGETSLIGQQVVRFMPCVEEKIEQRRVSREELFAE